MVGSGGKEGQRTGSWVAGLAWWLAWLGGWLGWVAGLADAYPDRISTFGRWDLYVLTIRSLRSDTFGSLPSDTNPQPSPGGWGVASFICMCIYIYMCVCVENRIRMQTMRCGTVILHTTANTLSMSLAFPIKGPSPSQSQYRCIELRGHAPKAVALRFRRKISNACAAQSASAMREESSPIRPQVSILYQNAYNNHVKT